MKSTPKPIRIVYLPNNNCIEFDPKVDVTNKITLRYTFSITLGGNGWALDMYQRSSNPKWNRDYTNLMSNFETHSGIELTESNYVRHMKGRRNLFTIIAGYNCQFIDCIRGQDEWEITEIVATVGYKVDTTMTFSPAEMFDIVDRMD